ncbi:MAG: endonuclease/exonuclease/phosphatase family protein [Bacteroidaceae bacterium]|nr:endonuclease/exonuclease/phosphatase family protein [Bacteroidaceae bacterium]
MAKDKDSSFGWVRRLVLNLFTGANLVTLFLLWACCASTWVNPALHPRVSVIGLLFPIFLFLNLLFLVLWLIFKPRMIVVPVVGMLLCGKYILDYCPLNFGSDKGDGELTVMSWNAGFFQNLPNDSMQVGIDYIIGTGADIVCLQESRPGQVFSNALDKSLQANGYSKDEKGSRVVLSRFPILSSTSLKLESDSSNSADVLELLMEEDTLTLINVHLECYHFSLDEKDDYGSALASRDRNQMKAEFKFLSGKLAYASRYRGMQVNTLEDYLDSLPPHRPVILCGDFNDTPISYAYQRIEKHLDNAFRARGKGFGISYREQKFPVRIDHIFYSHDWECTQAYVDQEETASDHYPVIASLKKRKK